MASTFEAASVLLRLPPGSWTGSKSIRIVTQIVVNKILVSRQFRAARTDVMIITGLNKFIKNAHGNVQI